MAFLQKQVPCINQRPYKIRGGQLKIILSNRIKIEQPDQLLKDILVEQLKHKNPKFVEAERMGKSTYKIPEFIMNFEFDASDDMYIPRGMRASLFATLNSLSIDYGILDKRTLRHDMPYVDSSKVKYRPYQYPAIQKLLEAPEGILVAPPGSGKTVMGLSLVPILLQPTLWITHTDRLLKQTHERCRHLLSIDGDEIGVIGGGRWDIGKAITIGMVQTLVRNQEKLDELTNTFGMIIVDECHHVPATTFSSVIANLNSYFLYGLTATAYRRDDLESLMFQNIGSVTSTISKKEVSKHGGIVSPKIVYSPLRSERIDERDPALIFKNHIIYNSNRNIRIKDDVVREATAGNFCIVASGRRIHCDILYEMIKKEWEGTGIATGKYSKKAIDEQIEAFDSNKITVLVTTPDLLGEGFDVDFLNRLFITTSFRTESRAEQLIGRLQRSHPNKKDAVVYDYVDEDIGVFANQFFSKFGKCRNNVYKKLGLSIVSYNDYMESARKDFYE